MKINKININNYIIINAAISASNSSKIKLLNKIKIPNRHGQHLGQHYSQN